MLLVESRAGELDLLGAIVTVAQRWVMAVGVVQGGEDRLQVGEGGVLGGEERSADTQLAFYETGQREGVDMVWLGVEDPGYVYVVLDETVRAPGDYLLRRLLGEVHDGHDGLWEDELGVGVEHRQLVWGFEEAAPGYGELEGVNDRTAADVGEECFVVDWVGAYELLARLPERGIDGRDE